MASSNPFDLLLGDDNDDPSQLIAAAQQQKLALAPATNKLSAKPQSAAVVQAAKSAKLPSKPLPPSEAVREARGQAPHRGRGGGRAVGRGRGGGGFNRDSENTFGSNNGISGGYRPSEEGDAVKPSERRTYGGPRPDFRGGRRGGFSNGESEEGERPRRVYERHSGTGRGSGFKRDGAGRGNWGTPTDEITPETEEPVNENEKAVDIEKQSGQEDAVDTSKDNPLNETEEKEPEVKEMTLEEYEKILEEKRKALLTLKAEERKVDLDKELAAMQPLSNKKNNNDDIFIKLGSEKDKKKDAADKEERAKKSVSINEFLKPAEGERYSGGHGRGRGRGSRGGFAGNHVTTNVVAPPISDAGHFPSLGAK